MSKLARFIFPTVVVALMVLASSQGVFAATELAYDDDLPPEGGLAGDTGDYLAVKFSLPSGWSAARLLTARFYKRPVLGTNVEVHILGSDGSTELVTPFTFDIAVNNAWNDADLTAKNIVVTGDFYIAIEYLLSSDPYIGWETRAPNSYRSFLGTPGSWVSMGLTDVKIRAVVEQILAPRPVGGVLVPVNKLEVLAPYLALLGLVGAVTAAVAVQRRRKT